jgi:hypothetical protein
MKKKRTKVSKKKKPQLANLPTEQLIEQLFPKEIVEELRVAAGTTDDDELSKSTKKES